MAWSMPTSSRNNPMFKPDEDFNMGAGPADFEVVSSQPSRKTYPYEIESLWNVNSINNAKVHKRPKRLKAQIEEAAESVRTETESKRQTISMDYDTFTRGLLTSNEKQLLGNQFLQYTKVAFEYRDKTEGNEKKTLTKGRAVLTDDRIYFVSDQELENKYFADVSKGYTFTIKKKETKKEPAEGYTITLKKKEIEKEQGQLVKSYNDITRHLITPYSLRNPGKLLSKSKNYAMWGHASAAIQYFSLPLGCIKIVELDIDMKAFSMTIIKKEKPKCCCGLCACCGCDICTNSWYKTPGNTGSTNDRILSLGVHLPPWGDKCYVHIYIDKNQDVRMLQAIIIDLQRYAPSLYKGEQEYRVTM